MLPKIVEKWYPSAGFLVGLLIMITLRYRFESSIIQDIASSFFTIFAIFCGFISTSLSILLSMSGRRAIEVAKSSGAFPEIIDYHWKAILWSFFSIMLAFIAILTKNLTCEYATGITWVMISAGIGSFCAVFRVVWLFVFLIQLEK